MDFCAVCLNEDTNTYFIGCHKYEICQACWYNIYQWTIINEAYDYCPICKYECIFRVSDYEDEPIITIQM
jgi:hypothetical protein